MRLSTFDIVVYLMNVYHCQSIPSHLHNNQFHIFQFSNRFSLDSITNNNQQIINLNRNNNNKNNNNIIDILYKII